MLVQAARAGAHPVVFVQHGEDEIGSPFETGTPHWQLHDRLQPADGDAVLHKRVSSAFDDTDLDAPWDGKDAAAIRAEVDARLADAGAHVVATAALVGGLRGQPLR